MRRIQQYIYIYTTLQWLCEKEYKTKRKTYLCHLDNTDWLPRQVITGVAEKSEDKNEKLVPKTRQKSYSTYSKYKYELELSQERSYTPPPHKISFDTAKT